MKYNCELMYDMLSYYCSLVIFRDVFFVSEGHRKPETYCANLCDQHKFCASRSVLLRTGLNSNVIMDVYNISETQENTMNKDKGVFMTAQEVNKEIEILKTVFGHCKTGGMSAVQLR